MRNLFQLIISVYLGRDRFRNINHVCTNYLSKIPFEGLFSYLLVRNNTARHFAVIATARNCVIARLFSTPILQEIKTLHCCTPKTRAPYREGGLYRGQLKYCILYAARIMVVLYLYTEETKFKLVSVSGEWKVLPSLLQYTTLDNELKDGWFPFITFL